MPLAVAILIWIAVATTTCLVVSLLDHVLSLKAIYLGLLLGTLAGTLTFRQVQTALPSNTDPPSTRFDQVMIYLFLLITAQQFFWILVTKGDQVITLNPNNIGDLPFHLTLIEHFKSGAPFWPLNPVYSYAPLHYPIGMDLLTAALIKLGLTTQMALTWLGLISSALTLYGLYRWCRGFAIAAFLFSGGIAGIGAYFSGYLETFLPMEAWKNIILTLFVPQRGFQFAFPAGLILLWSWRQRLLRNQPTLPLYVEGLLWGLMPLFHLHTFLFLSLTFAFWTLAQKQFKTAWPVLIWAIPPAVFEILLLTGFLESASVIWFKPGWMLDDHPPLLFFLLNFGLYIPLTAWALWRVSRGDNREHRILLATGLYTFVILMFVMFAPWEWDNTKLLVWSFLVLLPVLYEAVLLPLSPLARSAWYVGLFFAGAILLVNATTADGIVIANAEETDILCQAVRPLPIDERFAVHQEFNHPIALCGRLLVAGHPAHIWTHGYRNQWVQEGHLKNLMSGAPTWQSDAEALKVRYLFWGYRESQAYPDSPSPWETTKKRIALTRWGALYDLTQSADPSNVLQPNLSQHPIHGAQIPHPKQVHMNQ